MKEVTIILGLLIVSSQLNAMEINSENDHQSKKEPIDLNFQKAWIANLKQFKVEDICKLLDGFINNAESKKLGLQYLQDTAYFYYENNHDNLKYLKNHFLAYFKKPQSPSSDKEQFFFICLHKAQEEMQRGNIQKALPIFKIAYEKLDDSLQKNEHSMKMKENIEIIIHDLEEELKSEKEFTKTIPLEKNDSITTINVTKTTESKTEESPKEKYTSYKQIWNEVD